MLSTSHIVKIFEFIPFEKSNWLNWALVNKSFLHAFEQALETSPIAATLGNFPIKKAAQYGCVKTVSRLLRNPYVNPAVSGNAPLHYAAWNGAVEVVRLLLKDSRVDPADLESYVLDYSIENGHTAVVKEIINDGRVRLERKALTSRARQPITIAAAAGRWDIVNLLLRLPGIDFSQQCSYVLQEAYKSAEVGVCAQILSSENISPHALLDIVEDDMHGWQFMSALENQANVTKNKAIISAVRSWREKMRK